MCEIELYRKTKIDIPLLAAGMILCILSCLMISVGIARVREDVWIAGILVAIVGLPLFLFSLIVFCVIRTNNYTEVLPKQYVLGKIPPPTFTSIPSALGSIYHALFLLNEISYGYILVCRKMKKDSKRSYHGYGGYCPDCPLICRVFTNDMKRPESFQPRKLRPKHADEILKEKLHRSSAPRGIYDNPYNPGLWRRSTVITAPYT